MTRSPEPVEHFFVGAALFSRLLPGLRRLLLDVHFHTDVSPGDNKSWRIPKNQGFPCWLHRRVAQFWWLDEAGWGKANLTCQSLKGSFICSAACMEGR